MQQNHLENAPGFPFPTNERGEFITPAEQEAAEILRIAKEYQVIPNIVKREPDGTYTISGLAPESYKQLYEGNDNSDLHTRH